MNDMMQQFKEFAQKFREEHPNETPEEVVNKMIQEGKISLPLYRALKAAANSIMGTNY